MAKECGAGPALEMSEEDSPRGGPVREEQEEQEEEERN